MDYENLCRTCLRVTKTDAVHLNDCIFEFLSQDLGINSVPREHPDLQLPQIVCSNCQRQIIEFQEFLAKCRKAETFFSSKLEFLSVPNNNDDLEPQAEYCESISIEPLDWISNEEETSTLDYVEEVLEDFDDFNESASIASILELSGSENENMEMKAPIVDNPKQESKTKNKSNRKECSVCGKRFHCPSHLRDHENMHKGIKPYCCEVCGKCFTQKNTLVTHQALHYGKQVECEECGKKFARKSELIQHDRMHNDEKPFECDVKGCNAKFRQRGHLREHQAKHTGVRKFRCDICGHTFYSEPSLQRHKGRTHPKFSYQCDICSSWFFLPSYIRKHMSSKHKIKLDNVLHLKKAKNANENVRYLTKEKDSV